MRLSLVAQEDHQLISKQDISIRAENIYVKPAIAFFRYCES